MIIVPGKFIFLETPRTASKSCRAILLSRVDGAIASEHCHVSVEYALGANLGRNLPFVTLTRHPTDHLLSWYYACANKKKEFWRFVQDGLPLGTLAKRGFDKYHLNPYQCIADKVFPLKCGLDYIFDHLGIDAGPTIPHHNRHQVDTRLVTEDAIRMIEGYFSSDLAYYRNLEW